MNLKIAQKRERRSLDVDLVAGVIAETQKENGEIPWSKGNKTDPWNHVEAIMGLSIAGYFSEAQRGFEWMARTQLKTGCWYATYREGKPEDRTLDTNMSSYIAVGVYHHYLINGNDTFLKHMWRTVRSAIDFAISLQAKNGQIYWAKSPKGILDPMALLTGSSSIYLSLKCALSIARQLGHAMPAWEEALIKLGDAIKYRRHLFNVTKSRYSMDWFYPILSGALTGNDARWRIEKHWKKFVVEGLGVRCICHEPWVTIAETSELVLALSAMENQCLAEIVFNWIQDRCFDDGSYWCGFTVPDIIIWPEDKITWTNAVVLIAADALYNLTPASNLFSHKFWNASELSPLL